MSSQNECPVIVNIPVLLLCICHILKKHTPNSNYEKLCYTYPGLSLMNEWLSSIMKCFVVTVSIEIMIWLSFKIDRISKLLDNRGGKTWPRKTQEVIDLGY